jgi:hypothetical protein
MRNIDNSHAAYFHVVRDNFVGACSHQNITVDTVNINHIVGNKTMPVHDKFQGGLAFAHPRFT